MIEAKAKGVEDRSDSILVSFDPKWEDLFLKKHIFTVFRKRVPKTFQPVSLYVYINSPSSKIIGRSEIKKIESVDLTKAISLAKNACISKKELKIYIGNCVKIGAYLLSTFELAHTQITLHSIRKHIKFYPPQSFMTLSNEAKAVLDKLCSFPKEEK